MHIHNTGDWNTKTTDGVRNPCTFNTVVNTHGGRNTD